MTDQPPPHSLPVINPPAPGSSAGTSSTTEQTTAGNYFVANYPPFSFWKPEHVPAAQAALARRQEPQPPLGLYCHIPYCRKRCHFCYFRVYTDRNASQIRRYLDAVIAEAKMYAKQPALAGRKPRFVYFGGGTPSYLSVEQLRHLFTGLQEAFGWDDAQEVAFECEPGTLNPNKLAALRELGVTRLSLGIENFDDHILELNNRAHRSNAVFSAYEAARQVGFEQINIDLIAGMLGETDANWTRCIEQTRALAPECVTIYQMEIPFNTTIYQQMKAAGQTAAPVADWPTKRRWVTQAFAALAQAGYTQGSAYTAVRDAARTKFLYRDLLWRGADLLGVGVASFGHLAGIHLQNQHNEEPYIEAVERGSLPIYRALPTTREEQLVREFILQLKLGCVDINYFQEKFGVDVRQHFADHLHQLAQQDAAHVEGEQIRFTPAGLLEVDRHLHGFFLPQHRSARYA